jgi:hypothetical protein
MTTKRLQTAGTASTGIHHIAKVVNQANCIFQSIDQQNDVGLDGYIELIVDEHATGCCLAAQVKSGASYCKDGDWEIPSDSKHVTYWKSHLLPVCGIVYDPASDSARWVDITAAVRDADPSRGMTIKIPAKNEFSASAFSNFSAHFLAYRESMSASAHFGRTLDDLAKTDDLTLCGTAMRSLFSFHRNNSSAWHFLILSLPALKHEALKRYAAIALCHIPGHGDIFWHSKNDICEATRKKALASIRAHLGRDGVIALLSTIVEGEGIGRGTVGQCVHAIIAVLPTGSELLKTIILDQSVEELSRYWAVLIFIDLEQRQDWGRVAAFLTSVRELFTGDFHEPVDSLCSGLREHHFIDLW